MTRARDPPVPLRPKAFVLTLILRYEICSVMVSHTRCAKTTTGKLGLSVRNRGTRVPAIKTSSSVVENRGVYVPVSRPCHGLGRLAKVRAA